jgi:tRNA pseudouridine55 synthase
LLLLINKPSWITSHDAISAVKKHLRQPARDALSEEQKLEGIKPPKIKIWHAWTLDPMASWLMIAATDKDTKLLHALTWSDKTYETTIDFSRMSDTWDLDYRKDISDIDPMVYEDIPDLIQIEEILHTLIGTPYLPLTPFSAKKVDGKKLYEYAREWKPVFLTVPMRIYGYKIIHYQFPLLKINLHVWSGTYIRSIWHRLGTQIWWDALLISLHRTTIGDYSIESIKNPLIAQWDNREIEYIIL